MEISKATITFDHQPQIRVGGQNKPFELLGKNGKAFKAIDLGNGTFAKLKSRTDGKFDMTLFRSDGKDLSKCSVKVNGGSVSRLRSTEGERFRNNAGPGTLNGESIRFDNKFATRKDWAYETKSGSKALAQLEQSKTKLQQSGGPDAAGRLQALDRIGEKLQSAVRSSAKFEERLGPELREGLAQLPEKKARLNELTERFETSKGTLSSRLLGNSRLEREIKVLSREIEDLRPAEKISAQIDLLGTMCTNLASMSAFKNLSTEDLAAVLSQQQPTPKAKPTAPAEKPEVALLWFACRGMGWNEIKASYIRNDLGPAPDKDLSWKDPGLAKALQSSRNEALEGINAMKTLRDTTVNGMLDMLINKGHQELRFTAAGSDNPTSDYDVQLYDAGGLNGNPGKVIAEFNTLFRQRYGCESGTLFDTNLYDPSFRMPREDAVENAEINASEQRVAPANDDAQIIGSLAKIRKFASEKTWKTFADGLKAGLTGTDLERATQQLEQASEQIKGYNKAIADRKNEIIARDPAFASVANTPDGELRVKNELYAKKLEDVQKARQTQGKILEEMKRATAGTREGLKEKLDGATQARKAAMVEATLFAHEAYHSEGPMIDVVGNQQGVIKRAAHYPGHVAGEGRSQWGERWQMDNRPLRRAEMLGSFNEQVGDALKDIRHYGHEAPAGSDPFGKTTVQASKYVQRLFKMARESGVELTPHEKDFEKVNAQLKKLRDEGGPPDDKLKADLAAVGIENVAALEACLQELAVRVNAQLMKPTPEAIFRQAENDPQAALAFLGSLHISLEGISENERLPLASRVLAAKDQLASYGNHWDRARSALKNTPGAMDDLIEFRRRVVNGLVNELRGPNLPPFYASSVGSTAATSDIDMTLASPGAGTDIEAMKKFNSEIKRLFGKQPGYALDTNIYVQDYVHVSEKVIVEQTRKDALGLKDDDNTPFQPGMVFAASVTADTQVMSLIKMRRTMDNSEFRMFENRALQGTGTSQAHAATLAVKYSEADALFTLCNARLVAKLEETGPVIPAGIGDLSEADRSLLEEQPEAGSTRDILKTQMMQAVKVEKISQHDPNRLLEARNEVYAEVANEMRALDIDLRLANLKETPPAELAAMHAQRMRLTGQAIFFADEAYHSAGAVRHVVA
jgi:hypothetical protein